MGKQGDLLKAIREYNVYQVERLLKTGECYINGTPQSRKWQDPPIIECAKQKIKRRCAYEETKRCDILKKLVLHGADVNIVSTQGRGLTAAMWAAINNSVECLEVLAFCGADFNLNPSRGGTALTEAVERENLEAVELLVKRMTKTALNIRGEVGMPALSMSAANPSRFSKRCVPLLIKAGADLDFRDNQNYTALMYAATRKNSHAVKTLLQKGADINALRSSGKSVLTDALKSHDVSDGICLMLLKHKGDPALTRKDRRQMHRKICHQKERLVRALVKHGFPPLDLQCPDLIKYDVPASYRNSCKALSPLVVSLLCERPDMAKYFIVNKFLTQFDVGRLCRDKEIRRVLKLSVSRSIEHLRTQSLKILTFLSLTPQSLFTLSKVAVTAALTFDLARESEGYTTSPRNYATSRQSCLSFRDKVRRLEQLPPLLKRELLHQTPSSEICCKSWKEISIDQPTPFESCSCDFCENEEVSDEYYSPMQSD